MIYGDPVSVSQYQLFYSLVKMKAPKVGHNREGREEGENTMKMPEGMGKYYLHHGFTWATTRTQDSAEFCISKVNYYAL